MVKCCVVGCSSGYYKNNSEKVTQFAVSKDEGRRDIWARAIPRKDFVLNSKHFVCSKHFRDDDIIRFWQSGSIQVDIIYDIIYLPIIIYDLKFESYILI